MRTIHIIRGITLLMSILISGSVLSQESRNKLSVNPIELIGFNRLNIEYERSFREGRTGCAFYIGNTGHAVPLVHDQYSWLSQQSVAMKFYLRSFDRPCFWYGGMISVASGTLKNKDLEPQSTNVGALGLLAIGGYQFFARSLYADLYLGTGYAVTNDLFGSAVYAEGTSRPSNLLLIYGIKLGYKF